MNPAAPVTTALGALATADKSAGLRQPFATRKPPILIPVSRFEAWLEVSTPAIAVKQFPEGTRTAVDAARAIGCELGQIVKSLVFVAAGKPVVALVSGANRVDEIS